VVKLDDDGRVQLVAEIEGPAGLAIGKSGDLYVAQPRLGRVSRIRPDGSRITVIGDLDEPRDVVFDALGRLYVAETGAGHILKLTGDF
jgi:DNA-binding beta-propeller fold protein YncE